MFVTKYFMIGKVSVASSWVALILSFLLAYLVVRWKYGKPIANILGDAIFYFILVWKLSVIVTDFKAVLQFPLSILYFNGGTVGLLLGIVAASIKVIVEIKNKQLRPHSSIGLFVGVVIIQSVYQIGMALFNEGPLMAALITVILFSLFAVGMILWIDQLKEMLHQLIFLMMGLQLFVAVLQPAGLFQAPMFAAVCLGIVLTILMSLERKYDLEAIQ